MDMNKEWLAELADRIGIGRDRLHLIAMAVAHEEQRRDSERQSQLNEALADALRATEGDDRRRSAVWSAYCSKDPDQILEAAGLLPEGPTQ